MIIEARIPKPANLSLLESSFFHSFAPPRTYKRKDMGDAL